MILKVTFSPLGLDGQCATCLWDGFSQWSSSSVQGRHSGHHSATQRGLGAAWPQASPRGKEALLGPVEEREYSLDSTQPHGKGVGGRGPPKWLGRWAWLPHPAPWWVPSGEGVCSPTPMGHAGLHIWEFDGAGGPLY